MSLKTDGIGLAAVGLLGILLYRKVTNVGGDFLNRTVDVVNSRYEDFKTTTSETMNRVNVFSYTEQSSVYGVYDEGLKDTPKDVQDFAKRTSYDVGGYRDVSNIGTVFNSDGVSSNPSFNPVTVDDRGFGGSWASVPNNDKYVKPAAADSPFNQRQKNADGSKKTTVDKLKDATSKYTNWW